MVVGSENQLGEYIFMKQMSLLAASTVGSKIVATKCNPSDVMPTIVEHHYLHRKVGASFAFALMDCEQVVGAVTFGVPPSRHMQKSVCPSDPSLVFELNRLWIADKMARNTASAFVSDALRQLPPMLIASYADTSVGHYGTVYRALNFNYAGWTDEDRKTPRFDYVVEGKHSRSAFRGGNRYTRVRRTPKVRYWIATGNRRDKKRLAAMCGWENRKWDGGPGYSDRFCIHVDAQLPLKV